MESSQLMPAASAEKVSPFFVSLNYFKWFISFPKICFSGWKSSLHHEQRQQIIDSDWGGYALDLDLWEDSKSPVIQIRSGEVSLDDRESFGFLSDRLIGIGSSYLTRSPENGLYILSKCILKNRVLSKISQLD